MHNVTQPISNSKWFSERILYHEDVLQKVEKSRFCGRYDAGIARTVASLGYLEKHVRANKEKSCDIENYDINSLSNASASYLKDATRAHVSPNKNPDLSIYWYSTDACNLFHQNKYFHSGVS